MTGPVRTWVLSTVMDGSQVCKTNPELWFSENSGGMAEARKACHVCPFMTSCRLDGFVNSAHGMWGGLTRAQRRRMTTKQRTAEIAQLRLLLRQRRSLLPQKTKEVA